MSRSAGNVILIRSKTVDFIYVNNALSRIRKGRLGFMLPGVLFNRKVQITRAGWGFLLLIFFVGFAAINTANNLLYLIVGVMISLLIASFLLSEQSIENLSIERLLPEYAHAGKNFSITYRLTNNKRLIPSFSVMIEDEMESRPVRVFFPGVRARQNETRRASAVSNRRGRLEMKGLHISTRHPFGFFYKSKKANLHSRLIVYPYVEKTTTGSIAPPYLSGEIRRSNKGEGTELFGFREYIRGDNPRLIHWKISAKSRELKVREHEEDKKRSVIIELALHGARPATDDPGREAVISRAAGLTEHFINMNYQVRLETGSRGIDFGEGVPHMLRIFHYLALFDDPEKPWHGENLEPSASLIRIVA